MPLKVERKVVQRVLVGDVDGRQVEVRLEVLLVEDVVLADGDIEEVARRDALRIVVVVARVGAGNIDQARGELDWPGRQQARA